MRLRNPQKASSPTGSIILYKIRIHLLKIFDLGVFSFCEFLMHINYLLSKLRFYIGIWVLANIEFLDSLFQGNDRAIFNPYGIFKPAFPEKVAVGFPLLKNVLCLF